MTSFLDWFNNYYYQKLPRRNASGQIVKWGDSNDMSVCFGYNVWTFTSVWKDNRVKLSKKVEHIDDVASLREGHKKF